MGMPTARPAERGYKVEIVLMGLILAGIAYSAVHLARFGYLPSPFFYEPMDTFADWFNTAFWSRQQGAYDTWGAVYPPLSFVFLRLTTLGYCYPEVRQFEGSPGYDARSCDWLGLAMMGIFFVLNIVLTWKTYRKLDPATAPMRTLAVASGMPMLMALERGNLLIVAYPCVLLAFGPLVASARVRWVFAAMAINFKVYLVGAVAALLLKRRWMWVEGALFATAIVYLLSLAAFGNGTPTQIIANISSFSENRASQILDGWSAFTYIPLASVVELGTFPLSGVIGSRWVELLDILLPTLRLVTLAIIAAAAFVIWLKPGLFSPSRAVLLAILMALSSSESGIYTLIFVFLFVMMEPWRGFGRKWAIVMCYVLAIPIDLAIDRLPEMVTYFYFTGAEGIMPREVVLGPFLRPLMIMTVVWAISLTTLMEAFRRPSRAASSIPPANDPAVTRP